MGNFLAEFSWTDLQMWLEHFGKKNFSGGRGGEGGLYFLYVDISFISTYIILWDKLKLLNSLLKTLSV